MAKISRPFLAALLVCLLIGPSVRSEEPDSITVLTYNIFDPFFGVGRDERIPLIPEAIMALEPRPDIILLVEAFKKEHRDLIVSELSELGYPVNAVHYQKQVYGTGIMLISRFPLERMDYTQFRVDGAWWDPERYAGKGVHHYVLETPRGKLDFFGTHPISRFKELYDETGAYVPTDRRIVDRMIEMEHIARIVNGRHGDGARSFILAGDLNAAPVMYSYQYLIARAGVEDSFAKVNPGQNPDTYSEENPLIMGAGQSRIDHIFYANRPGESGFWLRPVSSRIVFTEEYDLIKCGRAPLSDHYGVMSSFRVMTEDPGPELLSPPPIDSTAKGDKRSEQDLTAEGIRLTPGNQEAWRAWAVGAIYRADTRYNRWSRRVVPAARVVLTGEVEEETVVPLSASERRSIRRSLLTERGADE